MSLRTNLPEIFKAASVTRHGIVYAETRRKDEDSLEGNLSEQDYAGNIPLVISQKNYERTGDDTPFEAWTDRVRQETIDLDTSIQTALGFRAIGYIRTVHGVELVDLDTGMASSRIHTPYINRLAADASIVTKLGYASCITPADCPVSNIIDPKSGAILQIHTGYAGLEKDTILHAVQLTEGVIEPSRSLVYVSPHAQEGYVINQVNNTLVDRFKADPFMADFVTVHDDGRATLDMTHAVQARLVDAGFRAENIEVSPDNSLTDPTLFSQSTFLTRGVNGRNGMIIGKRDN